MSQNLNVALTLSLNDRLSNQHNRTMQTVRRNFAGISDEITRLTRVTNAASGNLAGMARNIDRVLGGLRNMARAVPAAMAGFAAAKFVLADPIKQTQSYDLRLAHMANTAFTDRSASGRAAGMQELNASVVGAVRSGGGTRESAADTLDTLIASGAFNISDSMKLLPALQRASTAANADAKELAQIAITATQTFGIKREDIGQAIGMAIAAGQMGGFEIKDMAKWLPQQMAAGRMSGMSGINDFGRLLASNQAAVLTAGSKDAAGNNLVNLLTKINSQDTANDAKKLGIDLSGTLGLARSKGMNPLDAFVALVDKEIVGKNPQYQALRKRAAGATNDSERRATFDSMADIMQGSAVGKIVQDRQALMQLIAEMEGRQKIKDVVGGAGAGSARAAYAADLNFATIQNSPAFKAEQLAQEKAIAMQTAMDAVNPALGRMADNLVNSAREHPKFTAAVTASTLALTALAAAAGAAGLATFLTRGGAAAAAGTAAGGMGTAAASAGIGGAIAAALTSAKVSTALLLGAPSMAAIGAMGPMAVAGAAGGTLAAGGAGYGVGTVLNMGVNKLAELVGGPGSSLGTLLYDFFNKPVPVDVKVTVENGNVFADVMASTERSAKRR